MLPHPAAKISTSVLLRSDLQSGVRICAFTWYVERALSQQCDREPECKKVGQSCSLQAGKSQMGG